MNTLDRPRTSGAATPSVASFHRSGGLQRPFSRAYVALAALLVVVLAVGAIVFVRARSSAAVSYVTQPVRRADLVQSVTATGTINPRNTVAVGTQVSGTLSEVDVDFNSHVKKGQVLAKIDPTTFQAALDQARATLAQAQAQANSTQATAIGGTSTIGSASASANVAQANATASAQTARANVAAVTTAQTNVTKAASALSLAQTTVARDAQLLGQGYIAQSQVDADRSALVAAQSALDSARATVAQAQLTASASASQAQAAQAQIAAANFGISSAQASAQNQADVARASIAAVASARAQVQAAELNVQRTVITSPVDGTVVARDVSVGTTVAASLQTPTLFSIAQNLAKMEADLSVGEPDIGNVRTGDSVGFSVLAYPNRTFTGTVSQVRINPTITTNVVTYTVVVSVDNADGALLPGMTANASIGVAKAGHALIVPLAALSYRPARSASGAHARHASNATNAANAANATPSDASPWGATSAAAGGSITAGSTGRVFVERDGKLQRVAVKVGLVSGTDAAVVPADGTLAAGDAVVTSDSSASTTSVSRSSAASTRNPLAGVAGGGGFGAGRGR